MFFFQLLANMEKIVQIILLVIWLDSLCEIQIYEYAKNLFLFRMAYAHMSMCVTYKFIYMKYLWNCVCLYICKMQTFDFSSFGLATLARDNILFKLIKRKCLMYVCICMHACKYIVLITSTLVFAELILFNSIIATCFSTYS